ncbi:Deoxyribodipyrimidine photolyase [Caenispirillum salinarum AK4]|uniref:Deoxyribodipyrimidine photolyase n=1 Tax=Caenispirillum salinarum AK4 TaxID=1238182 RepID=K9H4I0_9PROT|nr:FAD-binding domain-containing protein [Caenispirillum salinarum]EKV32477.1 Deoxyribodipyrimidine photolyase [Caenispirillum salinarum AK4]
MPYDPALPLPEPTRAEGLRRLEDMLPRAGRAYAAGRNYDRGPGRHAPVSMLSPYLRHRLLTERDVVAAVLERHTPQAAEKFLQEVLWRTYWKGWLEMRPEVWRRTRRAVATLARDRAMMDRVETAAAGRTGIDCFDAWMTELSQTGYLHNHARMWTASIWVFTLKLPWELGADLFLRRLLDGDPASNTLSWRWVAGLHTPGKAYLARPDNIRRYTDGRFDPQGLADTGEPPAGDAGNPPPAPLPEPPPIDLSLPSALLLTEEDLLPEDLLPPDLDIRAAAAMPCAAARSPLPVAAGVRGFTQGALGNALDRLGFLGRYLPRDPAAVVAWAREHGARQVVTPYAPVGPARDVLDALEPALTAADIRLARPRRARDTDLWPLATAGFFGFWKTARGRIGA